MTGTSGIALPGEREVKISVGNVVATMMWVLSAGRPDPRDVKLLYGQPWYKSHLPGRSRVKGHDPAVGGESLIVGTLFNGLGYIILYDGSSGYTKSEDTSRCEGMKQRPLPQGKPPSLHVVRNRRLMVASGSVPETGVIGMIRQSSSAKDRRRFGQPVKEEQVVDKWAS